MSMDVTKKGYMGKLIIFLAAIVAVLVILTRHTTYPSTMEDQTMVAVQIAPKEIPQSAPMVPVKEEIHTNLPVAGLVESQSPSAVTNGTNGIRVRLKNMSMETHPKSLKIQGK